VNILDKLRFFLSKFFLYLITIRYLKFSQIFYQIKYRIRGKKISTALFVSNFRPVKPFSWPSYHMPSTVDGMTFTFLGTDGTISNGNWVVNGYSKLWEYNLHYLNDVAILNGSVPDRLSASIIDEWIRSNAAIKGVGWEAYPISLRLVNIFKFYTVNDKIFPSEKVSVSLAKQTQVLFENLEYHILANHLFVNSKALIFSGTLLEHENANIWLHQGLKILDEELQEQFLSDGGHFELSPMYHSTLLWDMCDLVALSTMSGSSELAKRKKQWVSVIHKGIEWLKLMSHPDKKISFFNDSAFNNAPSLAEIESYCSLLTIDKPVANLSTTNDWIIEGLDETGFVCVENLHCGHKTIMDVGNVGPDYQPGHAHADSLSFESSFFNHRVFVNSGTSQYGVSDERDYQRSTLAHNTVTVERKNSSEVWGGFRVARRARPLNLSVLKREGLVFVSAAHDGYKRLKGNVVAYREWEFGEGYLQISDRLDGQFNSAVARFFIHPSVSVDKIGGKIILTLTSGKKLVFTNDQQLIPHVLNTYWYPEFGKAVANKCIEVEFASPCLVSKLRWEEQ